MAGLARDDGALYGGWCRVGVGEVQRHGPVCRARGYARCTAANGHPAIGGASQGDGALDGGRRRTVRERLGAVAYRGRFKFYIGVYEGSMVVTAVARHVLARVLAYGRAGGASFHDEHPRPRRLARPHVAAARR